MRNETSYEWVAEPLDEHGDIIDPLFGSTLDEVVKYAAGYEGAYETKFALVKNIGNDIDGLLERGYAYFDAMGILERYFDNGDRVPKRFLRVKFPIIK